MNKYLYRVFVVYVFVFVFLFASRPLTDPDFWWHLKAGEYILTTGEVPRSDFYSFTKAGQEWVAHEWLSEAVFYAIYSILGFNGLIVIFALLTTLAFWIAYRRFDAHPFVGGLAVLLAAWTALPTIGVRPRVFTLLLASVYLAVLGRYARKGEARELWWLVPLMALWVNLHGGFLLGLALIVLTMAGQVGDAWAAGALRDAGPRLRPLAFVLLGCLAVVLLNPVGLRIYAFPFEIFLSPVQQQSVNDWLSPNFHQSEARPLAALILLTIAALSLAPKRPRPSEVLLFLATLYMTLKSQRHMAILALVAVPLLGEYLHRWLLSTPWAGVFNRAGVLRRPGWAVSYALLPLLLLVVFAPKLRATVYGPPRQEVVRVPIKAVEHLKARGITGNTFTSPNVWGGYLIWEMPSNPVYIDGRIDMYGDEFVREYVRIITGTQDWREPFDRYGVRVALVEPRKPIARALKDAPGWEKVYEDDMSVVFNRRLASDE